MTDGTQRAPEVTPDLRLRAERPRVTRLSRKVLIGLGGAVGLAVAAALIYALQTRRGDQAAEELYTTENRTTADGLAGLPRDYTGIPTTWARRCPAISAGRSSMPESGPARSTDRATAAARSRTRGAAACAGDRGGATEQALRLDQYPRARRRCLRQPRPTQHRARRLRCRRRRRRSIPTPCRTCRTASSPSSTAPVDRRTVSPDRLANPASPYVVQAGTVIPAALITGIRSDLPGQITAQVTEHVYDSPTGKFLLIPQGSRLIGQYDSQIAFGQSRVLLVWNRIMLPDGKSIVLERQPGADAQASPGSRTRSTITGGISPRRRRSRPCSASAPSSDRATKKAISSRRCVAAPRIRSTRPASRSWAASSTSSRRSPSARASRCA